MSVRELSSTVDMEEFREHLAEYLLESKDPVTITGNGRYLGVFLPARPQPTEAELAELDKAKAELDAELADLGLTEEELIADFKRWRKARRK